MVFRLLIVYLLTNFEERGHNAVDLCPQLISNLRSDPGYCLNVEVKLVQIRSLVDLIAHGHDQVLNALLS